MVLGMPVREDALDLLARASIIERPLMRVRGSPPRAERLEREEVPRVRPGAAFRV